MIDLASHWKEYELIDSGNGEKFERWQNILLRRPDPQAIWTTNYKGWEKADAIYHRSKSGGGKWEYKKTIPEYWHIHYKNLTFKVSPTNFKHTGIFPEQAVNWDWMQDIISKSQQPVRILNLFAYTGCATMACSQAGAQEVVHVDASKGMIAWAKENMKLCQLENNTIRFIVEDAIKFVQREKRRGRTYHGILMDPPSYGRGPNNEMWKIEQQINTLIQEAVSILDKDALFFLVNSYTTGFSPTVLENILKQHFHSGTITCGELGLQNSQNKLILPCGIYGKWLHD